MADRLFGTTGVRKIYGSEFDLEMALNLGKALGTLLGEGTVLVARDARTTGLMVADTLSAGLLSTGVNVIQAGIIPTPTLAFITMRRGLDAGVMVTASHNPPEYTGVKFWSKTSMGFTSEEERQLEEIYMSRRFKVAPWDRLGNELTTETAADEHIQAILANCDTDLVKSKSYTVVVDPGNGAACVLTPYLMQKISGKVVTINGQLDGHFPGRKSEPEESSLGDLIQMVKDIGADLGIAHDGDSDRVVFVTEKGEVVNGDRTIALLAEDYLRTNKQGTIVTTVDSSLVLDETVQKRGGEVIRTPVGDIQVAMKVKETGAVMGGEACGVFIFPEFQLAPEPFLAACRILEMMARTGRSFGDLIGDIPVYPLIKAKVRCPNEKKTHVMQELTKVLPKALENVTQILTVDGIGVILKEGWILVRPSGTEPLIRITCEGPTRKLVEKVLSTAQHVIEKTIDSTS
ncbi:MAG: phosphoglucosamine mutase [Candidatus Thorarchaeota archaeon]|nr:phosphoglucosamine mutase [Candidatus Thorarchaeota archaeon]